MPGSSTAAATFFSKSVISLGYSLSRLPLIAMKPSTGYWWKMSTSFGWSFVAIRVIYSYTPHSLQYSVQLLWPIVCMGHGCPAVQNRIKLSPEDTNWFLSQVTRDIFNISEAFFKFVSILSICLNSVCCLLVGQHFVHERRALPFNLSLTLEAQQQQHHAMMMSPSADKPIPSMSMAADDGDGDHSDIDADCSRRYCFSIKPADRCLVGCCRRRFCCDWQVRNWQLCRGASKTRSELCRCVRSRRKWCCGQHCRCTEQGNRNLKPTRVPFGERIHLVHFGTSMQVILDRV